MMPSDGPVRNTRAAQKARRASAREPHITPHDEESLTPLQDSAIAHSESLAPIEESQYMTIAEATGNGMNQSEGDNTPGNNTSSNPNTIHRAPEGLIISHPDQEQSYTTAHGSFGLSADSAYFAMPSEVRQDKGKGCIHSTPFNDKGNPSYEGDRQAPMMTIEEWEQYAQEIEEHSHSLH
jgi:hypothetical protein